MAEFWRALKTLKALQAEQAQLAGAVDVVTAQPARPRAPVAQPNEPERAPARRLDYALPAAPAPGRTLHEPAAPWTPNEPETDRLAAPLPAPTGFVPNEPEKAGASISPARSRDRRHTLRLRTGTPLA